MSTATRQRTRTLELEPARRGSKYCHIGRTGAMGRGGMGQVSFGEIEFPLGQIRPCAIKSIQRDRINAYNIALFAREALIGWDVSGHPNIVSTRTFGMRDDGRLFIVLDREGPALDEVDDELFSNFPRIQLIAENALSALRHIHRRSVIHGDVSQANILLSRDGVAKLTDFGLARRIDDQGASGKKRRPSLARGICGVPSYAAPEVLHGGRPSFASDAYSLGAVLYHLAADLLPYGSGGIAKVLARMSRKPPSLPDNVPDDLARVIEGLMAPEPDKRLPVETALAILRESDALVAPGEDIAAIADDWIQRRDAIHRMDANEVDSEEGLFTAAEQHLIQCELKRFRPEPEARPKQLRPWLQLAAGLLLLLAIPATYHWTKAEKPEATATTEATADAAVDAAASENTPARPPDEQTDGVAQVVVDGDTRAVAQEDVQDATDDGEANHAQTPITSSPDPHDTEAKTEASDSRRHSGHATRRIARHDHGRPDSTDAEQTRTASHHTWRRAGSSLQSSGGWRRARVDGAR